MATNNAYNPEVVQLIGGLDFVTPRTNTAPGALIDCYNFEVADRLGYKRVDGVEPYDGSASISNSYTLLYKSNWTASGDCAAVAGDYLYIDDSSITDPQTYPFAAVTAYTVDGTSMAGTITYYVFDVPAFLRVYSNPSLTVKIDTTTGSAIAMTLSGTQLAYQFDSDTTVQAAINTILAEYGNSFPIINTPATPSVENSTTYYNPAIGLTFFKDQEYAVVDCASVLFQNGVYQLYPGDLFSTASGTTAPTHVVRDIITLSGDWTAGDAAGKLLYSTIDGTSPTAITAAHVYYHVGYGSSDGTLAADPINTLGAASIPDTQIATMYRTWGPDQHTVSDLDSNSLKNGWREVDLGYMTRYTTDNTVSGTAFTKVGRDNNPATSDIVSTAYSFPAFADNLVDSGQTTANWLNVPAASYPTNVTIANEGDYIATTSNSNSTGLLNLSSYGFTDLPVDALITGIEVVLNVFNSPITTTNASYTIASSGTTAQSITVQSGSWGGLVNKFVTLTDGQYTIKGHVTSTNSTHLIMTIDDDGGFSGSTLASGAYVVYQSNQAKFNANLSLSGAVGKATPVISYTSGPSVYYNDTNSQSFTLGGSNDLWGLTTVSSSDLQSPGFAISLYISGNSHSGQTLFQNTNLDLIKVKVYYATTSSVYYFWNGTDDVKGTVTTYSIDDINGTSFADKNATGWVQIANVTPYGSAARNNIQGGDKVYIVPGGPTAGGQSLIALISSNMSYAGLPSLSKIKAVNSQYEFIEADFYGNTDWEAIYGCSGAGRAFTYDNFYFRYIYTGLNDTLDVPRHLAFNNFHLALGYKTGDLNISVSGEPENFDGTLGATTFSTGDDITGLLRMQGTTLGIFCRRSIQALNGTDTSNFSQSVLNPYEGAIEYTVVDGGNSKPVYASYKGISTFDQSNTYGNFLGSRLSANITPWLLPRLTGTPQPLNTNTTYLQAASNVLFATTIRNKNQYRLWFADGYYLTMTLMGQDQQPSFTLQQINFNYTNTIDPTNATSIAIPLAHSSAVDNSGKDRNHFSIYDPSFGRATVSTDYANKVWEIDRGWGFGPNPIRGWFTTTHNFFDNPFQIDNPRKVRMHGQSYGAGSLDVSVSADYESGDFQFGAFSAVSNAPAQDISLPRTGFTADPKYLTTDYQSQTNIANIGKRGRSFSLQFATDPSTIEPPTVCQALLLQTTLNKADV